MRDKKRRQAALRQVLRHTAVRSQAELQAVLAQQNIHVSQATLSRDIKELGLIKMPLADQRYSYVVPDEHQRQRRYDRLRLAFEHFVTSYDHAGNLLVVKTIPGTAAAVAADLDAMQWQEVVGTVAGDDTILIVVRSVQAIKDLHNRFQALLGLSTPLQQPAAEETSTS